MGFLSKLFSGGGGEDVARLVSEGALLIDARSAAEFAAGHLAGAVNLPHDQIAGQINGVESDKTRAIVVYCLSGGRSAMAMSALKGAGFVTVVNAGGMDAARKALGL